MTLSRAPPRADAPAVGGSPGVLAESAGYTKEYAEAKADQMCLRVGCISPGDNVVLIDDLIATGGTALAGFELVQGMGAKVAEFAAVTCLPGLHGELCNCTMC